VSLDRRSQIVALYATRHEHLPEPRTLTTATAAGFVHRTLAPQTCPTCEGLDDQRKCPTCRGRGWIETHRTRDPMSQAEGSVVPAVMLAVKPYGVETTGKLGHVAARDAELARLADQTAPPPVSELDAIAHADQHPYAWERARRAMYARYDYRALDVALERLHLERPGVPPMADHGLVLLSLWLPRPLRAPVIRDEVVNVAARGRGADPKALMQRDRRVISLLAAGASVDQVAHTVGLSARQLRRIANQAGGIETGQAAG